MTRDELTDVIVQALKKVAPEADPSRLPADADVREQLDIDSMDFLRFVVAVHQKLGVEVPEQDYPRLYTLAGAVDYFASRLEAGG
jgi:acyl carrier protein